MGGILRVWSRAPLPAGVEGIAHQEGLRSRLRWRYPHGRIFNSSILFFSSHQSKVKSVPAWQGLPSCAWPGQSAPARRTHPVVRKILQGRQLRVRGMAGRL